MEKPTHLEEVPTEGPTYAQMAEATDESVTNALAAAAKQYPGLAGAIMTGALTGVTRFHKAHLGGQATAGQVLQTMAPIISRVAAQLADNAPKESTLPGLSSTPPMAMAFKAIEAELTKLDLQTVVIWTEGQPLILVSVEITPRGVATYGSLPNVSACITHAAAVLDAHVTLARSAWAERDITDADRKKIEEAFRG